MSDISGNRPPDVSQVDWTKDGLPAVRYDNVDIEGLARAIVAIKHGIREDNEAMWLNTHGMYGWAPKTPDQSESAT